MKIELEGVTRCFGSQIALDLERLEIGSGEILTLSGVNGSGKTTLLRVTAGLDREYEGTILYDGKPQSRALAMRIAYVHQQPIPLRRSVYHNLEYPLRVRGVQRSERIRLVNRELACFDLTKLAAKRADRLSGGEMQKMSVARALLAAPDLILLDEPLSALDQQAAALVLEGLRSYQRETNATIVIVSHHPLALTGFAARQLEMSQGKILW